jgi:hypothetical protein
MRKLRILLFEVIGFAVLIGWLMWKYPELVDDIIPWVALGIAWHLTWEYIFDTDVFRHWGIVLGKRIKPMIAWPLIFLLGGSVSLLYWKGINKSLVRLSKIAAARAAEKSSGKPPEVPPPSESTGSTPSTGKLEEPKVKHPKSTTQTHETNEKESAKGTFLGVHKPDEITVIPPGSSAIISPHPLSPEDQRDLERLGSEDEEATKHLKHELGSLTVRDLFWLDFETPENTSVRHSGMTIRNDRTGSLTHISYAVAHQMQAGVKMLAFHIPYTNETPWVAVSLAGMYKNPLGDFLEGAIETGKARTGDSEQLSSQNLILSNRVFVYHETYLSPEQIIEARNAWKSHGVTVIFRGTDYLENRKLEIRVKQLEKRQ